jgi:hypothetical protein
VAVTRIAGFTPEQAEAIIAAFREFNSRLKLDGQQPPAGVQRWQRPRNMLATLDAELNSTDKLKSTATIRRTPVNDGEEAHDNSNFGPEVVDVEWNDEILSGFDPIPAGTLGTVGWWDNFGCLIFEPLCGMLIRIWYCTETGILGIYDGTDPPENTTAGPFETYAEAKAVCAQDYYCVEGEGCLSVAHGADPPAGTILGGPFATETACHEFGCMDFYCVKGVGCVAVPDGDPPPDGEILAGPFNTPAECEAVCEFDYYCTFGGCISVLAGSAPPPDAIDGPFADEAECLASAFCAPATVVWGCYNHPTLGWTCMNWLTSDGPPGGIPPETGPFNSEAECSANCPPFEPGWYCIGDEPGVPGGCMFLNDEGDLPPGSVIVNGPHDTQVECEVACV